MTGKAVLTLAALVTATASTAAFAEAGPSAQTRAYLQQASQSDTFEVMESTSALAQSRDPQLRAFAQQMIREHMTTSEALKAAARRAELEPSREGLGGDQSQFLGALQSLRGPAFDRAYWKHQMLAHLAALVTQRQYAASGDVAAVRSVAQAAIPLIQAHLDMATRMSRAADAGE